MPSSQLHRLGSQLYSRPTAFQTGKKKIWKSAFSWAFQIFEMVGRVGFEPTTNWLKANCSTN